MKRLFLSLLVLLSSTAAAWSQSLPAEVVRAYEEVIVHNGKIYTMDDKSNTANAGTIVEALAIRDGKILLTGNNKQIYLARPADPRG